MKQHLFPSNGPKANFAKSEPELNILAKSWEGQLPHTSVATPLFMGRRHLVVKNTQESNFDIDSLYNKTHSFLNEHLFFAKSQYS